MKNMIIPKKTKKGNEAHLSLSERCLTLHIIRHRPLNDNSKL